MAFNPNNLVQLKGRLTKDPVFFEPNKDGGRKVMATLAVKNNFKSRDGEYKSEFVNLEALVYSKDGTLGVYDRIHKGDEIHVFGSIAKDAPYEKDGVTVYPEMKIVPSQISFCEAKSVTDARLAARQADADATN